MRNNQLLRVLVIVGGVLPFVMLGYKLFEEESLLTAGLYTAVVVILFATVLLAWRSEPRSGDTATSGDGHETTGRS